MNPAEFIAAIARLGLTQSGAARELGVTYRTVRRWAAGSVPIPRAVELALKWLAHEKSAQIS